MKARHVAEALLAQAIVAGVRSVSWRRSLVIGAWLGDRMRALGIRRRVAAANLALAFPERSLRERDAILRGHYRELGRVAVEYARFADLVHVAPGEVVAEIQGVEHLHAARAGGRGAILLSGHFGHFELMGAWLGHLNPVDFVVRPLSNARLDAWLARERRTAGVGVISTGAGIRRVIAALAANHWVPMLADQDARRAGVFVPFFGRLASTPIGPARLALATGAPLVMGFASRHADGRHGIEIVGPLEVEDPGAPDAAARLTALHTARLEARIRQQPESWFWLHRRWKTAPPAADAARRAALPGAAVA